MVCLFPTGYVSMLILLFPDSLEFSLEDAVQSGKFWIPPEEKHLWRVCAVT